MKSNIIKLFILTIILFILFYYVYGFSIVKSNNMYPYFKEGELIIYYKLNKKYNEDEVILTNKNEIYRIIGKEYDIVDIKNNKVLINLNIEENKIYYDTLKCDSSNINYPYKIKQNEYFVLNDNRLNNNDSRCFGSINKSDIKGTIIFKLQVRGF